MSIGVDFDVERWRNAVETTRALLRENQMLMQKRVDLYHCRVEIARAFMHAAQRFVDRADEIAVGDAQEEN